MLLDVLYKKEEFNIHSNFLNSKICTWSFKSRNFCSEKRNLERCFNLLNR